MAVALQGLVGVCTAAETGVAWGAWVESCLSGPRGCMDVALYHRTGRKAVTIRLCTSTELRALRW